MYQFDFYLFAFKIYFPAYDVQKMSVVEINECA